jgi:hypothetical protein
MKICLVVVLAWLVGGCSTLRFAYENADTYVRWKAGSYVTLEGQDGDALDDRIDEFHSWHRKNELPKYAVLARDALKRFDAGLSRQDLVWGYDSLRVQARESLRKGAQLVAPLLDRLTPEQIAQIERRFAEDNRQFFRENLRGSERERRAKRATYVVQRLEDWVGTLSQAQIERVREYAARAPMADELRDRDRKRLQQDVLGIVRARQAVKRLPERVVNWERGREPALVAALDAWREQYFSLVLDINRSLSAEQRGRVQRNLRRYAADFEALTKR